MSTLLALATAGETRARLIAALDLFTRDDLVANPPADGHSMQKIGVGATNLDRYIRPWINQTFRDPKGLARLVSGDLKVSDTFAAILQKC
ncbi:hypothetical protein [Brevundimonas sp.]|jgi:hypothetical protein|uniref:hypothetical protein n=1 Tax=Brevundimonas sp. TaxID=1871086 RepID=UPI00391F0EBE